MALRNARAPRRHLRTQALARPQSRSDALLSHQHTIAVALFRHRFALADLEPDCIADPGIRALAARVSVAHDDALEARFPGAWPHRIRLTLDHGVVLEAESENPPGGVDCPLSRGEVQAKFRETAGSALGVAHAQRLADALLAIEEAASVRALQGALCAPAPGAVAGSARRPQEQHT